MLKLTRKTEYALLSLRYLQMKKNTELVTSRKIAEEYCIPFPVLSKVLQHLSREGYIEPVKGAHGGYRLCLDLNEINLWNFLETMEGPLGLVDCLLDTDCEQELNCSIQTPIRRINHRVRTVFNNLSVSDVTI